MTNELSPAMADLLDNYDGDAGTDGDPEDFDVVDPDELDTSAFYCAKCPDCGNAMTMRVGDDDPLCPQGCGRMTDRYEEA